MSDFFSRSHSGDKSPAARKPKVIDEDGNKSPNGLNDKELSRSRSASRDRYSDGDKVLL